MQQYINMNDSFGNKHSVSSTKSFQTFEQSIQTMKEQLYNHKKALETAENIVEQYQQENERLLGEITELREAKLRIEQKYEVLESLFIKLDKAKEKEMYKEVKRAQEKHQLEIENLNAKYQQHICSLNQRIFFLELQLHKYQNKQKKYQKLLSSYNQQKHTTISTTSYGPIQSNFFVHNKPSITKRQEQQLSQDSLQKAYLKTATKPILNPHIQAKQPRNSINSTKQPRVTTKPQIQLAQDLAKSNIMIGRVSVERKSRNGQYKEKGLGERKQMRHSQVRVNTAEDYFSHKLQMINKTTQKPRNLFIYDNNFTDYKDYRDSMH